jgi:hypothetical protein
MRPGLRRALAAVTAAAALLLGAPASVAAPAPSDVLLRGSHHASIEVTTTTPWTLPSWHPSGLPHRATFSGAYAGFMIERPPVAPNVRPRVVYAAVWVNSFYVPRPQLGAVAPMQFGEYLPYGGTLAPGRYRLTLFADGPSEVLIATGAPRLTYTPRDPVAGTVRVGGRPVSRRTADGYRSAYTRVPNMPGAPDSIAYWEVLSHVGGTEADVAMCLLPAGGARDQTGCTPDDNCYGYIGVRYDKPAEHYFMVLNGREGDLAVPGYTVSSPIGSVPLQQGPPVGWCHLPEGRYDVLATQRAEAPYTPPFVAASVFLRPAAWR